MPRVLNFWPSSIARYLLAVVIIVTALTAVSFWLYQEPGHGALIEPTYLPVK